MAFRTTSYRSNVIRNNENILAPGKQVGKTLGKLVSGPTLRRPALGEIGNRSALLQRSVSDTSKTKQNDEPFKKPVFKTRAAKKNILMPTKSTVVTDESLSECVNVAENTMQSLPPSPAVPVEDMSVVEGPQPNTSIAPSTSDKLQPLEEEQPTPPAQDPDEDQAVLDLSNAFSSKLLTVTDIDAEDKDNPQLVSEYVNEIYAYMRGLENKHLLKRRYLDGKEVTSRMRTILVDWLVQVHMRFSLMQETLYLTIAILDRYLQLVPDTPKDELQLVGITAMFVACKYEEMYCSEIGDYVYITDKAYSKLQIIRMEVTLLKKLGFYISFPLPLHFLRRNSKAAQVDGTQHTLAKYLMELCLPDYNMCHFKASEIGAAALCLTMKLIGDQPEWTDTLVYYSGYSEDALTPIMCKMAQCITRSHSSRQQAIPQKYRSSKHMKISEIPQLRGQLIRTLSERAATFT